MSRFKSNAAQEREQFVRISSIGTYLTNTRRRRNTPRGPAPSLKSSIRATGQSPWEKPIFSVPDNVAPAAPTSQSSALQAIATGKYDNVFGDVPDRPSALYRLAQNVPRQPFIEMIKSEPVRPSIYVNPIYPADREGRPGPRNRGLPLGDRKRWSGEGRDN